VKELFRQEMEKQKEFLQNSKPQALGSKLFPGTVKRLIGQGTQGSVFLLENEDSKQELAVKRINLVSLTNGVDQQVVKEVRKEIEVMKRLKNPFVISFLGAELLKSDFCIYMEFMNEGSLKTYYEKRGPVPEDFLKKFAL
jgi:serine/threonine protein kinase